MTSKSENTFGMRIKNAEDTVIILNSLENFQPLVPEDAPESLLQLIEELKKADRDEAVALQNFSVNAAERKNLITTGEHSLKKLISPIRAYLQAMYGKKNQQFINLNKILNQITGFRPGRDKKNQDEKTISSSQQSYASLTQVFSDLIATLQVLSPAYNPPNEMIQLNTLQEKYTNINQYNTLVTSLSSILNTARDKRNQLLDDLKNRLQRIKKSVQSQYGNTSVEYAQLKSYRY